MRTATTEYVGIKIPNPFWYSPAEVWELHREHILFVLSWAEWLQEGKYPPEHRESGYVGGGKSTRNQQCTFTKPVELLTEVCVRFNMCGTTPQSASVELWESIVNQAPLQPGSYVELNQEQLKVLNYVGSGFNRPKVTFKEFVNGNISYSAGQR